MFIELFLLPAGSVAQLVSVRPVIMRITLLLASALAVMVAASWLWLARPLVIQCGPYPQLDMMALNMALSLYRHHTGSFPTTAEGLGILATRPAGAPPGWCKVLDEVPLDPWGSPYVYVFPSPGNPERFDLLSLGPDRVPSADDVRYRWREPAAQSNPAPERTPTAGVAGSESYAHPPQ